MMFTQLLKIAPLLLSCCVYGITSFHFYFPGFLKRRWWAAFPELPLSIFFHFSCFHKQKNNKTGRRRRPCIFSSFLWLKCTRSNLLVRLGQRILSTIFALELKEKVHQSVSYRYIIIPACVLLIWHETCFIFFS